MIILSFPSPHARGNPRKAFHCHQGVAHPIFHSPRPIREETSWTSFQILEPFHFHSPRLTREETQMILPYGQNTYFHSPRLTREETCRSERSISVRPFHSPRLTREETYLLSPFPTSNRAFIPLAPRERKRKPVYEHDWPNPFIPLAPRERKPRHRA